MAITHKHTLGQIRKEFDDAKRRGLVVVDFRPKENRLDIGFPSVEPEQLDRLCEYLRGKWNHIRYEVFDDGLQNMKVMRITNMLESFDPALISLIRRSVPQMVAFDVVGVQPMTAPAGLVFGIKSKYTKGEE